MEPLDPVLEELRIQHLTPLTNWRLTSSTVQGEAPHGYIHSPVISIEKDAKDILIVRGPFRYFILKPGEGTYYE